MSLSDEIVRIVNAKVSLNFPREAKILSVNKTKKVLKVSLDEDTKNQIENVRWISPITPKKNQKCLVLFSNNSEQRPIAFAFSQIDELKTTIGEFTDLEISDQGVNIKHKNTKIQIETTGNLTISNNSLEIKIDGISQKIILKGDVKIEGKLDVTGDVVCDTNVKSISLKNHTHVSSAPGGTTSTPN